MIFFQPLLVSAAIYFIFAGYAYRKQVVNCPFKRLTPYKAALVAVEQICDLAAFECCAVLSKRIVNSVGNSGVEIAAVCYFIACIAADTPDIRRTADRACAETAAYRAVILSGNCANIVIAIEGGINNADIRNAAVPAYNAEQTHIVCVCIVEIQTAYLVAVTVKAAVERF